MTQKEIDKVIDIIKNYENRTLGIFLKAIEIIYENKEVTDGILALEEAIRQVIEKRIIQEIDF